ncbi:hypothetical protein JOS77_16965 [Chromobacterium haemolyticum]|nr:hypothetical protein JOS77_16965 [Chromobacterium haemolyticum]
MKLLKTRIFGTFLASAFLANAVFAEIAPANITVACPNIQNVIVTSVYAGWVGLSASECPDQGNCISFQYRQATSQTSAFAYVHVNMNLNDGDKGRAMFDMLQNAMVHNLRVTAYGSMGNGGCGAGTGITGIQIFRP